MPNGKKLLKSPRKISGVFYIFTLKKMKTLFKLPLAILICFATFLFSCSSSTSIQQYNSSSSHFNNSTEGVYPYPSKDVYRAYNEGKSGTYSIDRIRQRTENQIKEFAAKAKRGYKILSQRNSNPPYILGNYPRVEIIFALTSK